MGGAEGEAGGGATGARACGSQHTRGTPAHPHSHSLSPDPTIHPPACPPAKQVYDAYFHGFTTLKGLPPVTDMAGNDALVRLLRRLVDEHSPMLDALAQVRWLQGG